MNPLQSMTGWVARHAVPTVAATALLAGAAAGGIGYTVAAHGSTGAAPAAPHQALSPSGKSGGGLSPARGQQALQHALQFLATQTGQSVASVRSQLQQGTSVDDIAGAKAPAIETAILAQLQTLANRAVGAGKISQAQATQRLTEAKPKLEQLMAEPGTQLLQQARQLITALGGPGGLRELLGKGAAPTLAPTP